MRAMGTGLEGGARRGYVVMVAGSMTVVVSSRKMEPLGKLVLAAKHDQHA